MSTQWKPYGQVQYAMMLLLFQLWATLPKRCTSLCVYMCMRARVTVRESVFMHI